MSKKFSPLRPATQALALESRLLFDGAAAVAVADHDADVEKSGGSDHDALGQVVERAAAQTDAAKPAAVLVVIDATLTNLDAVLASAPANAVVRLVQRDESGLKAIADELAAGAEFSAIHIVSHGHRGEFTLGSDAVDQQALIANAGTISRWAEHLGQDADILIYGCDVAQGETGTALISQLAHLTGADVAASVNPTGSALLGGDWQLEAKTGQIDVPALSAAAFAGVLGTAPTIADSVTATRSTPEDTPLTITGVSVADADSPAAMSATLNVSGGTVSLAGSGWTVSAGADNSATVTITGSVTAINSAINGMIFTPTANQNSTLAGYTPSITISVSDVTNSDGPTMRVISNLMVSPVNDAPSMSGGSPLVVSEGGTSSFSAASVLPVGFTQSQLGLSDVDNSAAQTIIKITAMPSQGSLLLAGKPIAIGSILSVADITSLSYRHNGSQVTTAGVSDTFQITVDDGAGGLVTGQTVSVSLNPVNQPPVVSGTIKVIEGESSVRLDDNGVLPTIGGQRGAISISDPEGEATNTFQITSLPTHGTLFYNGVAISSASVGSPFNVADRTLLTYTHDGSETLTDSFVYEVKDAAGHSDTGTVTITVSAVNDAVNPLQQRIKTHYNLLGNVHWLEHTPLTRFEWAYYNLLGNVHWLELRA